MKLIHKSPIPESKTFVIKNLRERHFDPELHSHPEYQLFVVLEGRGSRFIGDSVNPFRAGDMVFTGPHLPHLWRSDKVYFERDSELMTRGIVIYIWEHFLNSLSHHKAEMEQIYQLFQKAARGLEITGDTREKVTELMVQLTMLDGIDSIITLLQILNILAKSAECFPIAHVEYVNVHKEMEKIRMNKVYGYIMNNFQEKISFKTVAKIAHMSPTSFSRYFTSRARKSLSEFLKEIRISHACKLLLEDEMNIGQIANECGYYTISNFNKHFMEIMKSTPTDYKKNFQEDFISTT